MSWRDRAEIEPIHEKKARCKTLHPLLHESVSGTPTSQREAKLSAFSLCLLPWHSSWCQRLILIGLFPCQMEAADSQPRCAWLVWRPDYLVSVSSWPLIKGTLTHITFQLFTLQGGGGAPFKQFPALKPAFVIFSVASRRAGYWAWWTGVGWQKASPRWGQQQRWCLHQVLPAVEGRVGVGLVCEAWWRFLAVWGLFLGKRCRQLTARCWDALGGQSLKRDFTGTMQRGVYKCDQVAPEVTLQRGITKKYSLFFSKSSLLFHFNQHIN